MSADASADYRGGDWSIITLQGETRVKDATTLYVLRHSAKVLPEIAEVLNNAADRIEALERYLASDAAFLELAKAFADRVLSEISFEHIDHQGLRGDATMFGTAALTQRSLLIPQRNEPQP